MDLNKLISESLKASINETIRAEEAYHDKDAIQTVIDGKRDLGFITLKASPLPANVFWSEIKENGLKVLKILGNVYDAYIYYRDSAESKALELQKIAEKYGGYLSYKATKQETIRIGELLGYDDNDIQNFVNRNYPENNLEL